MDDFSEKIITSALLEFLDRRKKNKIFQCTREKMESGLFLFGVGTASFLDDECIHIKKRMEFKFVFLLNSLEGGKVLRLKYNKRIFIHFFFLSAS